MDSQNTSSKVASKGPWDQERGKGKEKLQQNDTQTAKAEKGKIRR